MFGFDFGPHLARFFPFWDSERSILENPITLAWKSTEKELTSSSFVCRGLIHISNIAHGLIQNITDVFEVGEQIKMMVVNSDALNTISFRYLHVLLCVHLIEDLLCYVSCSLCQNTMISLHLNNVKR